MSDKKNPIHEINEFIEKHSLQKIMKIVYGVGGIIIVLNIVSSVTPTKYYNCANQETKVMDKVLACEQQKVDERIREKELELERYKTSENYKMEKLKAVLAQIDLKEPKKLLRQLESELSAQSIKIDSETCLDKAVQSMCEVKFK